MTLSLQSFALRVWWKPRASKPTWKNSSLNKGREEYAMLGKNISPHLSILNGDFHLKYHRDCIRSVWGFRCRSWCNFFLWCYEMIKKVLHPPTALAAEQQGVKLNRHSPLIHVALGSCAWSFPLKMSSILTFFLEARLSSSSVSRRFGQYYKNRQENKSLSRWTAGKSFK